MGAIWIPEDPIDLFAIAVGPEAGDREFNRMIQANTALCGWLDGMTSQEEAFDWIASCEFDPYEHIQSGVDYLNNVRRS